jgi:hypothetical protein
LYYLYSSNIPSKKPSGKIVIPKPSESLFLVESIPVLLASLTPKKQSQIILLDLLNPADSRAQLNQAISNTLRALVQLTDDQFYNLLERLAPAVSNLMDPIPRDPFNLYSQGIPIGSIQGSNPDDSPSDNLSYRSYQDYRSKSYGQHGRHGRHERHKRLRSRSRSIKHSPKHKDPDKLNDGTLLTYIA